MEFHDDIFPDTPSDEPGLTASEWFSGANGQVKKNLRDLRYCRKPTFGQVRPTLHVWVSADGFRVQEKKMI